MSKKISYIIISLIIFISQSCVSEYIPLEIAENPEILVVDGVITNGETVIRLSKSIALDESFLSNNNVNYANIYIETGGGVLLPKANRTEPGKYVFSNVNLNPDSVYRLRIQLGEDIFISEYLEPQNTPEIDSITWQKNAKGDPVSIFVHTQDAKNASRFYRWTFNEIWEFSSPFYANGKLIGDSVVLYDRLNGPFNERYYCWQWRSSSQLIVETSANLTENHIMYKKIHEIEASNKRLSLLYYINVNQYHIRKSAYDYFENLQKNIESMGRIFAPIPSGMNGNIRCINRDISVIGFIDVALSTNKSIFISGDKDLYEPLPSNCDISPIPLTDYLPNYYDDQLGFDFAPAHCIDCVRAGGSKMKPDFWPNNHF